MFRFVLCLVIILTSINLCSAFSFKKRSIKVKPVVQKMSETTAEWENEAQNIPLEQRKLKDYTPPKSDKKHYYPEPKYSWERYNFPAGSRDLNVEDVKKNLISYPYMVVDTNIKYGAYPRYYYNPENNQVSSEVYVEKLDSIRTKEDRIVNFHHEQQKRTPVLSSGTKETYSNLFNGLTIVDWNKSSDKILIKEKIGSSEGGIYKTVLYVYSLGENRVIKLSELDNAIKDYLLDYQDLQIVKYRYDIKPLGFSADDDNSVIALAFVYDKNDKGIFLGAWQYNCMTGEIRLLSDLKTQYNISSSGLFLKKVTE